MVIVLFVVVTGVGFAAARWRRAEEMMHLDEWGLGGRGFGTFITWFLLGGDLYTAYTFIAVPALVYGTGAAGFYALSYTIMVFPIVLVFAPRLWSIARVHGYVTPADFVKGRYGSRRPRVGGARARGPGPGPNGFVRDLPLLIAFVVLAFYTYISGLRAPALIAFVKDGLVYVMVIVAVIYIPTRLGGWSHIFGTAS